MADKKLLIGLEVRSGNSVQEIERVRDAAVRFGKDGAANADHLARQLQNVENGAEKVAKKISQGRVVTVADSNAMAQSFAQLERVIEQAFGSIQNAPQEIQAALGKAEQQVAAVRTEVVASTKAVQDNRNVTNEAGASWQGLGKSVEDAAGKHGAMVAKAGLVTAAFKEGWQVGQQLNAFFGTDMQVWNEVVSNFGSRANVVIRSIADNITGTMSLAKAVFTGNFDEAGKLLDELAETGAQTARNLSAAFTSTNAEWNKYAESIGIVSDESRKAKEEAAKLAEEKKKLAEKIHDVVAALQNETAELEKQKSVAQDSALRIVDRSDQLSYYGRQLDSATAALRAQQAEVANLTARHGENDPVVVQAREKIASLEATLKYAQERYRSTSDEVKRFEDQQRSAERAIEQSKQRIESLNEKQGELTGGTTAATEATEKQATAATKAATSVRMFTDEAGKIHIVSTEAAAATEQAAASTTKLAAAADAVTAPLGQVRDTAAGTRDSLWGIVDALDAIIDRAPRVAEALKQVGSAAAEAAGPDEASSGASGSW